jgi:uncharacterized membrane-anchored protein YhcB (DUF1043 family)
MKHSNQYKLWEAILVGVAAGVAIGYAIASRKKSSVYEWEEKEDYGGDDENYETTEEAPFAVESKENE